MTTYTTKVHPGWRASEVRDIVVAFSVASILWILFFTQAAGASWDGLIIAVASVFSLAGLLGLYFNFSRKRKATLLASMNTDGWRVQWWGRKPLVSVWGTRLSALYNQGSLDQVESINFTKVGKHEVFEFMRPAGRMTLPKRLADTDEVRDFLLAWVESKGGQITASDRTSMEAFAGVLSRGRDLQAAPEEAEAPETPDTFSNAAAEVDAEKSKVEVPPQA